MPTELQQCTGFRVALHQLGSEKKYAEAIKTGVHSGKVSPFFNHMSLAAIEARSGLPSLEYTLVYSVRNPYAKIISLANMNLSFALYTGKRMQNSAADIKRSIGELFKSGRYNLVRNHGLYQSKQPYKEQIILRQEHLAADFGNLLRHLDIVSDIEHLPHAKQGSFGKGYSVGEMYTRTQLDIINDAFSDEFLAHGYAMI